MVAAALQHGAGGVAGGRAVACRCASRGFDRGRCAAADKLPFVRSGMLGMTEQGVFSCDGMRDCFHFERGFHSPSASESLSLACPLRRRNGANGEAGPEGAERRMRGVRGSNQREGHPDIRADRTASNRCPAVLVVHRPANNSAIPGLKQFAFPRWSTPLLGAAAGGPEDQGHACGVEQSC